MGSYREKKTVKQRFLGWGHQRPVFILEWLLPVLAVIFIGGAVWCLYLAGHRDYERLAFVLMPTAGGMLTIWVAQGRFIEQQEREDKRQDARLESEAKMHNERLKSEFEREHERLTAEAQKDRAQRSINQRIDLAEKLATAVEHLSSEKNELKQAAGVQEILFQIDDWYALIESEIAGIEGDKAKKDALEQEGLRHRQELFDIAYKFDTENMHVLKSRARGLKQRLGKESSCSLVRLDFSGLVLGQSGMTEKGRSRLDLRNISAGNIVMNCAKLQEVDLENARLNTADLSHVDFRDANLSEICLESANLYNANLKYANLIGANLRFANLAAANLGSAKLWNAHLESVDLRGANLKDAYLKGALYDEGTIFPEGFDPKEHEMEMVVSDRIDEQQVSSLTPTPSRIMEP